MWRISVVVVGLLPHICGLEDGFKPPAVPFARLMAPSFVGLGNMLAETGVVAVTEVGALKEARLRLLRAVSECSARSSSFKQTVMPDGTERRVWATERSLPIEAEVARACPTLATAATVFRALQSQVGDAFMAALDRDRNNSSFAALRQPCPSDGACAYTSFTDLNKHGSQLEHFTSYSPQRRDAVDGQALLELHVDDGLLIQLTPPLLSDENMVDEGLEVQHGSGVRRLVYPTQDSVVFMVGGGLSRWLGTGSPLADHIQGVPHRVKRSHGHLSRSWYGRMFLPPPDVHSPTAGETFATYRRRQLSSPSDANSADSASAGCGSHKNKLQSGGGERRELQQHVDVESCPDGEFHCWMRCYLAEETKCPKGSEPQCMSNSKGEPCEPNDMGCGPRCVLSPTAPPTGIPTPAPKQQEAKLQEVVAPTPATSSLTDPPERHHTVVIEAKSQEPVEKERVESLVAAPVALGPIAFCHAGSAVSMYMEGFQSPGDANQSCVIFLFRGFVLDSIGKYAAACMGTIALGLLLELLIFRRRMLRSTGVISKRLHTILDVAYFGTQATLGYTLMLVAMTYSTPLFVCTVTGLVIGHVAFNSEAPAADSATPCCEGVQYGRRRDKDTTDTNGSTGEGSMHKLNGQYTKGAVVPDVVPDCCAHIDMDALGL